MMDLGHAEGAWLNEMVGKLRGSNEGHLDLRILLRNLGIELLKLITSDPPYPGEVRRTRNGAYRIYIYRSDSRPRPLTLRERFTVAHEVGHILLHERYGLSMALPRSHETVERLCNEFAGRLLVPSDTFQRCGPTTSEALVSMILQNADRFRVSREVVVRRALEEGWRMSAVSVHSVVNQLDVPVALVDWAWSSSTRWRLKRNEPLTAKWPLTQALLSFSASSNRQATIRVDSMSEAHARKSGTDGSKLMVAILEPVPLAQASVRQSGT